MASEAAYAELPGPGVLVRQRKLAGPKSRSLPLHSVVPNGSRRTLALLKF